MQEEWGPWVDHDGSGCPVAIGTVVEVVCEDRFGYLMHVVATARAGHHSSWDWRHYPRLKRILRYRVKKPRGMVVLEAMLNDVRTPERV